MSFPREQSSASVGSPGNHRVGVSGGGYVARILAFVLGAGLLALPALAQVGDAAYCAQLGDLARRYTGSAGGEGRLSPDLSTLGAIDDCNKGNTAAGIAVLEKKLRSQGFTLPKR